MMVAPSHQFISQTEDSILDVEIYQGAGGEKDSQDCVIISMEISNGKNAKRAGQLVTDCLSNC